MALSIRGQALFVADDDNRLDKQVLREKTQCVVDRITFGTTS